MRDCSACQKATDTVMDRSDAYGIFTGYYCDPCYDDPQKYTYRRDRYFDASYAGESLEES